MIMTIMTAALEKPNAWHLEDNRNVCLTLPELALGVAIHFVSSTITGTLFG